MLWIDHGRLLRWEWWICFGWTNKSPRGLLNLPFLSNFSFNTWRNHKCHLKKTFLWADESWALLCVIGLGWKSGKVHSGPGQPQIIIVRSTFLSEVSVFWLRHFGEFLPCPWLCSSVTNSICPVESQWNLGWAGAFPGAGQVPEQPRGSLATSHLILEKPAQFSGI